MLYQFDFDQFLDFGHLRGWEKRNFFPAAYLACCVTIFPLNMVRGQREFSPLHKEQGGNSKFSLVGSLILIIFTGTSVAYFDLTYFSI